MKTENQKKMQKIRFGKVKWFGGYNSQTDSENDFGFIQDIYTNEDVFVHKMQIKGNNKIYENQLVSYIQERGKKGFSAKSVEIIVDIFVIVNKLFDMPHDQLNRYSDQDIAIFLSLIEEYVLNQKSNINIKILKMILSGLLKLSSKLPNTEPNLLTHKCYRKIINCIPLNDISIMKIIWEIFQKVPEILIEADKEFKSRIHCMDDCFPYTALGTFGDYIPCEKRLINFIIHEISKGTYHEIVHKHISQEYPYICTVILLLDKLNELERNNIFNNLLVTLEKNEYYKEDILNILFDSLYCKQHDKDINANFFNALIELIIKQKSNINLVMISTRLIKASNMLSIPELNLLIHQNYRYILGNVPVNDIPIMKIIWEIFEKVPEMLIEADNEFKERIHFFDAYFPYSALGKFGDYIPNEKQLIYFITHEISTGFYPGKIYLKKIFIYYWRSDHFIRRIKYYRKK